MIFFSGYYRNGNQQFKGEVKNGKQNGYWFWYNKEGSLNNKDNGTNINDIEISD